MQCRVFLLVAHSQSCAVLLWGHVADEGTAAFHLACCCTPGTLHSEQSLGSKSAPGFPSEHTLAWFWSDFTKNMLEKEEIRIMF